MSAAAYSRETHWDIPVAVWPGVLCVSVVLHVCLLLYGLPGLSLSPDPPEPVVETEVILEAGGPVFEQASPLPPRPLDLAASSPAEIAEPIAPETVSLSPADAPAPATAVPVRPELVEAEQLAGDPVAVFSETTPVAVEGDAAQQLEPIPAEEAAPVQELETVPATVVETLPAVGDTLVETVTASEIEGQVLQPETHLLQQPPETEMAAPVPLVGAQAPLFDTAGEAVPVLAQEEVATLTPLAQSEPETPEIVQEQVLLQPDPLLSSGSDLSQATPVLVPETATEPPVAATVPARPPVTVLAEEGAQVITPADTLTLAPMIAPEVETLAPSGGPVSEVLELETELAALSPAEPETSAVPSVAPTTTPAEILPPVEIATVDPLARVTGYVENYAIGACAHLSVLSAGTDSAEVAAFGRQQDPFVLFDRRFAAEQGFEASIRLTEVSERQCTLLNALGVFQGIEAAGLVELDRTVVRSGAPVSGLVHRDLPVQRIAAAQQTGLDLSGRGPPELYLVDDAGQIHDGRDFLLPASSAATAGAWRFKVPVVKMSAGETETALVLAIWNRPASRQPVRFGTLPAGRTDAVLSEPGVYSLAAFKVSR